MCVLEEMFFDRVQTEQFRGPIMTLHLTIPAPPEQGACSCSYTSRRFQPGLVASSDFNTPAVQQLNTNSDF